MRHQLYVGPGAYKGAILSHRNAVTAAITRVAGMSCTTEQEKKEILQADLERNVDLCLYNSFCRKREQKVNVVLMPSANGGCWNKKVGARPATLLTCCRRSWKSARWVSRNKKQWSDD